MTESKPSTIYWSLFEYNDWKFNIAATDLGLCYVGSPEESFNDLKQWGLARLPELTLTRNDEALKPYAEQLTALLQGTAAAFSFPLDLHGTPFQLTVWEALSTIPYGETASYSSIAERVSRPNAVRAVSAAIGANPVLIALPCHRVVGMSGMFTDYRGGSEMKEQLLENERSHGQNG